MDHLFRLTLYVCVLLIAVTCNKIHVPCGNGKCICCKDTDQLKMDCSNRNISSVREILKDIPVNTTILDLSGNDISLLKNKTFGTSNNLTYLQVLNLKGNKIKTIHKLAFKGLNFLKLLDISGNCLTNISDIIPGSVQELDVSHNIIEKLNNYTFSSEQNAVHKLQKLQLQNNTLEEIEQLAFEGLYNLQFLNLSNNSIPFMLQGLVPAIFKPLRNLRELEIQKNKITESPDLEYPDAILSDIKSLEMLKIDGIANATFGPGFNNLTKLSNLTLSGLYTHCQIHTLKKDVFRFLRSLKHLDISDCDLSVIEAEAFSPLYQLNFVDMSGNKDLGYSALPSVFFGLSNTTAETLKYSNMFQRRLGTELKVSHLQHFNETKLKNVYIDDNALETCEVEVLNYFPKTIEYISAQSNRLIAGHWLFYLKTLTNLEILDISYQYRSRKPDIHWHQGLYFDKGRQIRSAPGNCTNLSFIPEKLKKIYFVGSKQEYMLPCVILGPQSTQLEEIRSAGNIFHSWQGPITGLNNLKILDLSRNYCSNVSMGFFSGMQSLQELYINTNFIGLVLKKQGGIFKDLTKLRILDLSFNVISKLPTKVFEEQVHLERLDLSTNGLVVFKINMQHMTNLTHLNLAGNSLVTLPLSVRKYLEGRMNEHAIEVDLSDNPIKCTCDNRDFIYWLSDHRDGFVGFEDYTFIDENGEKIQDFNQAIDDFNRCDRTILVISAVGCIIVLLTVILLCILYRYRWKLRYLYYMTKSKYRGYKAIHGSDTPDDYRYDAFISYAAEELRFVKNELVPELENERDLVLSVHQRDFMAGNPIAENIVDAVTNSCKTVLIITNNFLKSDWCLYEFRMAQMESNYSRDGRDIFIIVMLENVPNNTLPLDLLRLIQSQTYIEYPVNTQDRELFWNQVKDAIKQCE